MTLTIIAPEKIDLERFWDESVQRNPVFSCGDEDEWFPEEIYALFEDADYVTHPEVVKAAMTVWDYIEVCRFFHMQIEEAAVEVNESVEERYPTSVAATIVRHFTNKWNGCPEALCEGALNEFGE